MSPKFKYFTEEEFACPCCGKQDIDPNLVARLDLVRGGVGTPLSINSGIRCEKHNKKVGGVDNSAHVLGQAADVHVPNSRMRFLVLEQAMKYFNRIGVYKTFIHLDIAPVSSHTQQVIWHGK